MEPLAADDADRLAAALTRLQYTVDGVTALIGQAAMNALARNETSAGRHALSGHRGVDAVPVRVFCLRDTVQRREVADALGQENADLLVRHGILQASGPQPDDAVRCALDLHPYGDESHDWWVLADPVPGMDGAPPMLADDHVLGVNEAATTLAGLTLRSPVPSALDVGTGSGLQTLHLSQHADHVVGSDILPRALEMARWSASLNGLTDRVEFREGDLLEPVRESSTTWSSRTRRSCCRPARLDGVRPPQLRSPTATRHSPVTRWSPGSSATSLATFVRVAPPNCSGTGHTCAAGPGRTGFRRSGCASPMSMPG